MVDLKAFKYVKYIVILIVILVSITALNPLTVIEPWQKWVVFSKFGWIKNETLSWWIHFRIPLIETIYPMNVRTKKIVFSNSYVSDTTDTTIKERLDSSSSDLQDVYVDAIITYSLNKDSVVRVFKNVWEDYEAKKIVPVVMDSIKTHTAKFKVEEILTNREKIKAEVEKELSEILLKEWITLEWVSLSNFNFHAEFKRSIEEKQIAEQKMEKEKYELQRIAIKTQQKVKEAAANSEARIKEAEWSKRAQILQAEWLKQAKVLEWEWIKQYNILIKQEISKDVLDYKKLENQLKSIYRWDWAYPVYYMWWDKTPIPLLNIWTIKYHFT